MNSITKTHIFSNKRDIHIGEDLAKPTVYFRGVNRVQINRFKAYTLILSNKLIHSWHITQDIKSANIVVEWVERKKTNEKYLRMSVLSATANLKPPVIRSFKLSFEEKVLTTQLNKASKQLYLTHHDQKTSARPDAVEVVGLLDESLSQICSLLNKKNSRINFKPSVGIFSSKAGIYNERILLIIDPNSPKSIHAYQTLLQKKVNGDVVINELIIAIINISNSENCEEIFDRVYENADDNTQVTLVNFKDENELHSFVTYF